MFQTGIYAAVDVTTYAPGLRAVEVKHQCWISSLPFFVSELALKWTIPCVMRCMDVQGGKLSFSGQWEAHTELEQAGRVRSFGYRKSATSKWSMGDCLFALLQRSMITRSP